jgi:hypothetical protein
MLELNGFVVTSADKTGNYVEVITQLWTSYIRELLFTHNKYVNIGVTCLFIFPFHLAGFILSKILPKRQGLYFDTVVSGYKK